MTRIEPYAYQLVKKSFITKHVMFLILLNCLKLQIYYWSWMLAFSYELDIKCMGMNYRNGSKFVLRNPSCQVSAIIN